jgi:hypothetical protein
MANPRSGHWPEAVPWKEPAAGGNTDGDLAMLQWTAGSPHRTLQLVVQHTDAEHEYAYDRHPILGSGTGHATATEGGWTVIDMAADRPAVYPPVP